MSYILDALRKADRERALAKVPTLASVHQQPAESSPRRLWPWIALAVILGNLGVLAWLVSSPPGPRTEVAVQATEESSAAAPAAPAPEPAAPVARVEPDRAPPAPAAPVAEAPPLPASRPGSPREPVRDRQAAIARPPAPAAPPAPVVAPPRVEAPPSGRVDAGPPAPPRAAPAPAGVASAPERPALTAPPSAAPPPAPAPVRAGAPDIVGRMRLQFLVYSEVPTDRLVFINNQKYLEGQSIDGKLTVERITPDSVVLGYQGERFVLRAESGGPR